jgi:FkbM family methyltransferase
VNFSGIPQSSILGRILRLPLRALPQKLRVPILQGPLRGKRWIVGAATHGCWLGSYEYANQRLFSKAIKPGSVVYDVGANVGFYSLLAATLVGPQGHVVAFEPVPRNIGYLRKHLKLNGVTNVTIVEAAAGVDEGSAWFDEGPDSSMGHLSATGGLRVHTVCIDAMVAAGKIPPPEYLKIDVEGAEGLVLTGAKSTLVERLPTLFLSTHGPQIHRECLEFLRSLRYEVEPIGLTGSEGFAELIARPAQGPT